MSRQQQDKVSEKPYFRYWGKAGKSGRKNEGALYHLLPFHCLDVAAVGNTLLEPHRPLCKKLSTQLNCEPTWLQQWFTFCLLLHDLGKFFRSFQNLSPDMSDRLVPSDFRCEYRKRHDTLGYWLWRQKLATSLADLLQGASASKLSSWIEIVCGHHGQPPEQSGFTSAHLGAFLLDEDIEAAELFIRDSAVHWLPDMTPFNLIDQKRFKQVSWQLAGLSVLADWLGSNQEIFNYADSPIDLQEYWEHCALTRATQAVSLAQLEKRKATSFTGIRQQFSFIDVPTPLQRFSETLEIGDSPHLFILEDVTGSGKTEAAMVLVHRLMAASLADGVYVGLPTMATANAMYDRMRKSYRCLYEDNEQPSLVLSHGARDLSDTFRQSVSVSAQEEDKSYGVNELSASAYCNQWLADNRKKSLLADVGVGTIDQALLGVLPARHQSLRLFGLAGKVLLVDEVHAYDSYMRQLLINLLRAHAAQKGSVILLSATLPSGFKQQLLQAYASGAGLDYQVPSLSMAYPLATSLSSSGVNEAPVETRASVQRKVRVERVSEEATVYDLIRQAVEKGQCVCWVRNTVRDASNSYRHISAQNWVSQSKLTLFHSRFAMVDRQAIEDGVRKRFGPDSAGEDRTGQVLIATQVVEQSLDLDFDVMITDIAPIDLLIQRAGRLQRHIRSVSGNRLESVKDQREAPILHILAPDHEQIEDEKWLQVLLPGSQAVYPHVGQLWLGMQTILKNGGFSMPEDARSLIENVYGDEAQAAIPHALINLSDKAEGKQRGDASMGAFNCLNLETGYTRGTAGQNSHWDDDVNIPTRLGQDSVTVALARVVNDHLLPYCENMSDERTAWALSQLSVPRQQWLRAGRVIPVSYSSQINELKEAVPGLRWVEIFPLTGATRDWYEAEAGWGCQNNNIEERRAL